MGGRKPGAESDSPVPVPVPVPANHREALCSVLHSGTESFVQEPRPLAHSPTGPDVSAGIERLSTLWSGHGGGGGGGGGGVRERRPGTDTLWGSREKRRPSCSWRSCTQTKHNTGEAAGEKLGLRDTRKTFSDAAITTRV